MIIYLIRPAFRGANARFRRCGTVVRRYPRIAGRLPFLCFVLHRMGFFRASRIAPRAVSSYSPFPPLRAFLKEPAVCFSVTLSVNPDFGRGCPRILRGMLPYGVRNFPPADPANAGSPAFICHRLELYHNQESKKTGPVEIARGGPIP